MEAIEVGFSGEFLLFDCNRAKLKSIKLAKFSSELAELGSSSNWNLNGKNKNTFIWCEKENPELIYFNNNNYYRVSFEPIEIK